MGHHKPEEPEQDLGRYFRVYSKWDDEKKTFYYYGHINLNTNRMGFGCFKDIESLVEVMKPYLTWINGSKNGPAPQEDKKKNYDIKEGDKVYPLNLIEMESLWKAIQR